ncbi:PAS-domain containing protein [Citreimonas sp.]|uniref:PAS-domain containing protein n=1 Tax=Citreimonas sp. TaxID=3036715 RepID=UPI0035C7DAC2
MEYARLLAEERRARLAAERLLEQKQAQLRAANRELDQHARALSRQVTDTRAEVVEVRSDRERVATQLGQATEKIEVVESRLWQALGAIRDGFAMFDQDGRMELANPSYLGLFDGVESVGPGASYEHIVDVLLEEGIVDPDDDTPAAWRARMIDRWNADPIPDVTLRLWDGRFVQVSDRRRPEGGIVTLGVDITALMRMWSAVEELPDGFVMFDAEDRLVMCNQRYRELYPASAPAMQPGTPFEEIIRFGLEHGQYADAVGREEEWLEERMNTHRHDLKTIEQRLDDDRWIRVYERATREGGRVGLRVDITRIKHDQVRLKEAMLRAEAASRAKSAFLANMSHEIRTPMNGVVGMADLLMDTTLDDDQRTFVDTIRSSGEALLTIINDILDYSKIEADRLDLNPEPFDLERIVHDVMQLLQPAAYDKGLSLLVDYDMFLPARFHGDPGRLRQILTNLVGNAIKFTHEGRVLVRVVGVPDAVGGTTVHLTVEDTGIGIAAEKIDHVFGEFNQVETDRNRQFEGTGLGLAITRRLVEMMNGTIWVESELDRGSCFGLSLPLKGLDAVEPIAPDLPEDFGRALVVASDSEARDILGKQLASLGVAVTLCSTGAEFLDLPAPAASFAVIADALDDMPGADLIAALGASGAALPVILLSGRADVAPAECGAHAVLRQPVSRAALAAAVESIGHGLSAPAPEPAPTPRTHNRAPDIRRRYDVLVAEDNKTNQLVFSKMVAGFPLDLRFADNGLEAVEAFRDRRPDLVFMDISMPQMDGKQATAEIRAIEDGDDPVPIIAVTAHAMSGDRDAILQAGLSDYLTKPLRKAHLAEKLRLWAGPGAVQPAGRTKVGASGDDISALQA